MNDQPLIVFFFDSSSISPKSLVTNIIQTFSWGNGASFKLISCCDLMQKEEC